MARQRCDYSITDEQFILAVNQSTSIRQVLNTLGLASQGGNYRVFYRRVANLGLNTDHLSGQGWAKNQTFKPKRPLSDYLTNPATVCISSHSLRLKLLNHGLKEHRCELCMLTEWGSNPIPLELDHIDGNHSNNLLENLRVICPNCHALTSTYRGKNKKLKRA